MQYNTKILFKNKVCIWKYSKKYRGGCEIQILNLTNQWQARVFLNSKSHTLFAERKRESVRKWKLPMASGGNGGGVEWHVRPPNPKNPIVFFDITIGTIPAGRIKMELFADIAPKTAENFRSFHLSSFLVLVVLLLISIPTTLFKFAFFFLFGRQLCTGEYRYLAFVFSSCLVT